MKRNLISFSFVVFYISLFAAAHAQHSETISPKDVKFTISLSRTKFPLGEPVTLEAVISNNGPRKIAILPDRNGHQHGWSLSVEGPGGEYRLTVPPGEVAPLKAEHFVTLWPGESFSQTYSLDNAAFWDKENERYQYISKTPGSYRARLTYMFNAAQSVSDSIKALNSAGKSEQCPDCPCAACMFERLKEDVSFISELSTEEVIFKVVK